MKNACKRGDVLSLQTWLDLGRSKVQTITAAHPGLLAALALALDRVFEDTYDDIHRDLSWWKVEDMNGNPNDRRDGLQRGSRKASVVLDHGFRHAKGSLKTTLDLFLIQLQSPIYTSTEISHDLPGESDASGLGRPLVLRPLGPDSEALSASV